MNAWQKLVFFLSLIVGGQVYATNTQPHPTIPANLFTDKYALQRQQYQEFMQFLSGEVNDNSVALAVQLLPSLQDYPLYPYAWYRTLIKQTIITPEQLQQFLAKNTDFPLNNALIDQFYQKSFQQKDWALLAKSKTTITAQNSAQQCIQLVAKQQLSANNTAELNQIWQATKKLWLSGDNLAKQCVPLFQAWQQAGNLTEDLIQQRAELAMAAQNRSLLNYLQGLTQNKAIKQQLQEWLTLLNQPQHIDKVSENWSITKQNKQILLTNLPRYFKTIPEQNLDFIKLQLQLTQWQQKWQFSNDELALLKRVILQRFFDNTQPQWLTWRDQQIRQLKNDALTERRLRVAIRQQQPLSEWLALLSTNTANKDEWRYWQAWQWQQQGKKTEAQTALQQLSQQRGFYALLAAETLGIDYQPTMQDLPQPITFDPLWQSPNIAQAIARITELRHFRYLDDAYSEWAFLLKNISTQQALLLSEYALQQQWFDLAVAATIKAKAWDYIRLRLPLAYQQWFTINVTNKGISPSFAMAIARQESAWRPNVRSSANAIGLMQLLPSTAKSTAQQAQYNTQQANKLTDPLTNILLGTAHLAQLAEKYGDNRLLIAAAYNAGAKNVDRWLTENNGKLSMAEFIASIPFYETRNYVQNVVSYDYYYQLLNKQIAKKFSKAETDRLY
ncbi:transglycosylase SLT domain-containing protein [Gallibacterium trehalosifermentans]|uniref:Transglycosylase SLT domain-containing protein n=1 Tax=Gallibacterium trehalosifermentans TaxID=516935 RepID=A0ABV6H0M8_9PAST